MSKPIVTIVGRPNVGKSTLFNRLIGKRLAIVHDEPGVTRDRHYANADWAGTYFTLIDTGGFVPESDDIFEKAIREQAQISIEESDAVIFLVDATVGIHPMDEEIAGILRKSGRPILLAVNKVDSEKREVTRNEFYSLGLGEPYAISALGGRLIGDFLDELTKVIPEMEQPDDEERQLHLAVIGRPNVGKSSLVNSFLGKERAIVTEIPGTTRDAIDSTFHYQKKEIVLIDTAGLRRRSKIKENVEYYSTLRTLRSIDRADVALLLIDAMVGLTHQDIDVLTEAVKLRKGIVIGVNKWDLVEKETNTAREFELRIHEAIKTFDYIPVVFLSALTKQRIAKSLDLCLAVHEERSKRIDTSALNEALEEIIKQLPPPSTPVGKEVKLNYVTQVKTSPPVLLFFSNEPKHISQSYRRFLERRMRDAFGFKGVPLTLQFRRK